MTPSKNVNYPMIETYLPGLKVDSVVLQNPICAYDDQFFDAVSVKDLEAELAKGVRVKKGDGYAGYVMWHEFDDIKDTHEALLIGIQEIKPQKVEFETVMEGSYPRTVEVSRFMGKKVKVTIEEIK